MSSLKKINTILQNLVKNELHPDEFIEGDIVLKYINEALSVIDSEYETEEEYNAVMEEVFNEPYNKETSNE